MWKRFQSIDWKRAGRISGWSALGIVFVVSVGFTGSRQDSMACTGLHVHITDTIGHSFVEVDDVEAMIRDKYGAVEGKSLHAINTALLESIIRNNPFVKTAEVFIELGGKTLGIIGIGRIGLSVAKIALGCGMRVIASDPFIKSVEIPVTIYGAGNVVSKIETVSLDEVLREADFITLHVPGGKVISKSEIEKMKDGVCLVNAARGGVIVEQDLIDALNSGKVAHAALDVFENEPTPSKALLTHPKIALTPHIGAATEEAQERIGIELAEKIIAGLN